MDVVVIGDGSRGELTRILGVVEAVCLPRSVEKYTQLRDKLAYCIFSMVER